MSAVSSMTVPASAATTRFNTLPFAIALFCLLWSFAFVAGKIGVTDCPPLILLAGRFSLAGILILGASGFRLDGWQPARARACRGAAPDLGDPWGRQQRALSRARLHRAEIGLGGSRWPDRFGQSGVY